MRIGDEDVRINAGDVMTDVFDDDSGFGFGVGRRLTVQDVLDQHKTQIAELTARLEKVEQFLGSIEHKFMI